MPSTPSTRKAIITDIQNNHDTKNTVIYECGSGWGGLARKLAYQFPEADIHGFEISPIPYFISRIHRYKNLRIKRENLFKCDYSKANIIITYLSPYHMEQLAPIIEKQAKKGCILYSQGFPIPSKSPIETIDIPYSIEKKVYKYRL